MSLITIGVVLVVIGGGDITIYIYGSRNKASN
jgi:hypothetical protein